MKLTRYKCNWNWFWDTLAPGPNFFSLLWKNDDRAQKQVVTLLFFSLRFWATGSFNVAIPTLDSREAPYSSPFCEEKQHPVVDLYDCRWFWDYIIYHSMGKYVTGRMQWNSSNWLVNCFTWEYSYCKKFFHKINVKAIKRK